MEFTKRMKYDGMLTMGSLMSILNNEGVQDPVMQVLGIKKISAEGLSDRYRLVISDGQSLNSYVILISQLNSMIYSKELTQFAIVKIKRYLINSLSDRSKETKQVLFLADLAVLVSGEDVGLIIGDPKPITNESSQVIKNNLSRSQCHSVESSVKNNSHQRVIDVNCIHPINSLTPYKNKWTIKGRVVKKSPIRTWSNQKGEGKFFNMDLIDESGEIRATAFSNECDKFFDTIKINNVYFITRGTIKTANKKFSNLNNDYELTLSGDTQIDLCQDLDESEMPTLKFNFTQLNNVKDVNVNGLVDVIGVCQITGDLVNLLSKTTRKELKKRNVTIVDQSLSSITITLWNTQAENFDGSLHPVIAIKGSRISEFMGIKSLSLLESTVMQINPDIEETHRLINWYNSLPSNIVFNSTSAHSEIGCNAQYLTIKEAQLAQMSSGSKANFYSIYSYLIFVKSESALYKACPKPDCQKKVIYQNDGTYLCEKCNDETKHFKYRLLLQAQLSDSTGNQWVTFFQESAESILGTTSAELGKLMEKSKEEYSNIFQRQIFKLFDFRVRAKMETYNNETRLKICIVNAKPIDYKVASLKLIADIKRLNIIST